MYSENIVYSFNERGIKLMIGLILFMKNFFEVISNITVIKQLDISIIINLIRLSEVPKHCNINRDNDTNNKVIPWIKVTTKNIVL